MAKPKPMRVALPEPHPFSKAFPTVAFAGSFVGAVINLGLGVVRTAWPFRRELAVLMVLDALWAVTGRRLGIWWGLAVTVATVAAMLAVPAVRSPLLRWLRCGRTSRQLLAAFRNTRATNTDGKLPRIVRARVTVIGDRLQLRLRPGQSFELLEVRTEEYRAACKAREVRLTRDANRSNRVTVDVVRRDTLAQAVVPWAGLDRDGLSIWDPVAFGISELGEPVTLSLIERAVLLGGNRGAGKSNALNVFVAHVAKCPDADLLLIDANRVQLGIWQGRALGFAAEDPDDALSVLLAVQAEMVRRLECFAALPGSPVALTRNLAEAMAVRPWVLVVDELAFHTSVAGTSAQQKAFYATIRDIVARGRAAGMVPIVATQRPTHDLIPTSLRDLFDIRIAFRTMTRTSSDVILGDDFAKRGFCATDIDLNARGVALMLADGSDPVRLKAALITPEIRTELAVSTVGNRGTLPAPAAPAMAELEIAS